MRRYLLPLSLTLLLATGGAARAQMEEKPESRPGVTRPAEGKEGVTRPAPDHAPGGVSPAGGAKGGSSAPT